MLRDILLRARLFFNRLAGGSFAGQDPLEFCFFKGNEPRLLNLEVLDEFGNPRAKLRGPVELRRARQKGCHIAVNTFIEGRALDLLFCLNCEGGLTLFKLIIDSSQGFFGLLQAFNFFFQGLKARLRLS